MKAFLQIVALSVVTFLALAMLEERETFTRPWFTPAPRQQPSAQERRAAADAVYAFRTLSAHGYGTDGDARFLERIPASQPLIDDLRADIDYVRRNARTETPRLMRIEFLSSEIPEDGLAEVTTREFWVTEFRWRGGGVSDETRSDVLFARYRLHRDGSRWLVDLWEPIDAPGAGR